MPKITYMDMRLIDKLFEMEGGWVLNFSNKTFSEFFIDELNIEIDDPKYEKNGTSKAKRLRTFLNEVDSDTAVRTLRALWKYRADLYQDAGKEDGVLNAESRFIELIEKIGGNSSGRSVVENARTIAHARDVASLKEELLHVASMPPQSRGFAFEKFLNTLFSLYGLSPRPSFRLVGEQIDGSFQLAGATYLVEAKWQNSQTGAADLHAFHGKIEEKAAWARGLFISHGGFTEDGLKAFGRAKKLICMDGLDLWDALDRQIPFFEIIERKARKAAESGDVFVRIRDLFQI